MNPDYFVWVLTVVDVVIVFGYVWRGNLARAAYWIGAAIVMVATLFMGR
ncbi:hypothetical protein LCGC14_1601390 [marine sediment metagenome]|uniref:Uncharacterized protein n=1 Tax=marine sediment metagenome TaxID=412755 RepID=A0A0F9IBG0_9ZZZZ